MKSRVTETIFSGTDLIIPFSSVQHIEKQFQDIYSDDKNLLPPQIVGKDKNKLTGVFVITDKTKWSFKYDTWENACFISNCDKQAENFIKSFCDYITERDGMLETEVKE